MKKFSRFIIALIIIFVTGCNLSNSRQTNMQGNKKLFSTEKYTVFPSNHWSHQIEAHFDSYNPDGKDIESAWSILEDEFNKQQSHLKRFDEYRIQFIGFRNEKKDRIILGNALCDNYIRENKDKDWQNEYIIMNDGGNCFFQIEINLDTNEVLNFNINGEA